MAKKTWVKVKRGRDATEAVVTNRLTGGGISIMIEYAEDCND